MKQRCIFLNQVMLILLVWAACIYKLYVDYDNEYLTKSLIHTSLIIIASLISAFAINSDFSRYKQNKSLVSFISTFVVIACISGLLLTTYLLKKQDDTTTVLYAISSNRGWSDITLDFRKNSTYKLGYNHFLSTGYIRGHYTKKDSVIYLNKPDVSSELASDKLILKTVPISDSIKKKKQKGILRFLFDKSPIDTMPQTFLFQVNDKGEIIDSAISFKVIWN